MRLNGISRRCFYVFQMVAISKLRDFMRNCKIITARNEGGGRLYKFSQACVILFTGGGVCLSACWDTTHPADPPRADTPREQTPPWSRHPPGADTHLGADPPPAQSMLGDTVNARALRILLECNLVF